MCKNLKFHYFTTTSKHFLLPSLTTQKNTITYWEIVYKQNGVYRIELYSIDSKFNLLIQIIYEIDKKAYLSA